MVRLILKKMLSTYHPEASVAYGLWTGSERLELQALLGQHLRINFTGRIVCVGCGREIKKSYQQGYCFPCTQSRPETDLCIVRPERCHFHRGTCRDPEWGTAHCMIPHTIYLAQSSGVKVGITRSHQCITRWIDQGATQALAIASVTKRLDAGVVETLLSETFADRTNWRKMLQGQDPPLDLLPLRDEAWSLIPATFSYQPVETEVVSIQFPVLEYPTKIRSHQLEKTALLEGTLLGIKGQYLIFDTGVINIRSHSGYDVELEAAALA